MDNDMRYEFINEVQIYINNIATCISDFSSDNDIEQEELYNLVKRLLAEEL